MKLGVSSYSFNQCLKSGEMELIDTISKAKEIGFDCIEFIPFKAPGNSTVTEYAAMLRDEAQRVGIEINCYAVGGNLAQDDEAAFRQEVEKIKKELDIAAILGAKIFRNDATANLNNFRSFDLALPTIVKGLREIADYGKALGIKTCVENHGHICQDSERMERLFNAVNHDNFGLLVDMGNFACVDENSAQAVSRLASYAIHVHAKDMIYKPFYEGVGIEGLNSTRGGNYIRGTVCGHGNTPVKQCISILKNKGYKGDLSLEFEGAEPCLYGITTGHNNLRGFLKELDLA